MNKTKKDNYKTDVMSLNIDDIEEAPVTSFNNNKSTGIPGAVPVRKRRIRYSNPRRITNNNYR